MSSYSSGPSAPPVIVLDGEQRAALAVVRSLGRRGRTVHVGSSVRRSLAGGSRYAASETVLPDPMGSASAYVAAICSLRTATGATVLLPVTEASTLAVLEHRDSLGSMRIPTADLPRFRRACDKADVLRIARTLGLDTPREWSWIPGGVPMEDMQFPVVVKPTRSLAGHEGSRRKASVAIAESPEELESLVSCAEVGGDRVLVQSRISGPGVGVFLLRWNGEVIASFAHRRLREKPPSGGVSVRCESIGAPPRLIGQARALLDALDWHGVAMIEFKQDAASGRHYLMEVNPRLWGSLQLAIDAGVDFPAYLLALAEGATVPQCHTWTVGCQLRWTFGELDHLIARLRHSRSSLHLSPSSEGLIRVLASFLVPWQTNLRGEVFRISDPVPGLREIGAWIRGLRRAP